MGGFYTVRTHFRRLWARQDAKRGFTLLDLVKTQSALFDESDREARKRMKELDEIMADMPWKSTKRKSLVYRRRRKCATA